MVAPGVLEGPVVAKSRKSDLMASHYQGQAAMVFLRDTAAHKPTKILFLESQIFL